MATIDLKNLTKTYENGFRAVRGIDLAIQDHEFMVFVGPSGCGKSTTLRMIAGLESVTSGDLHIGTRRVNNIEPQDRDIAMVFQSYALYPHLTVRENLGFALSLRRLPSAEIASRVERAADMLTLGEHLQRYPRQLSGGQRQRVAVGRAIVRDPAVFLFYEPLSNLDAKLRGEMRTELKRLQQHVKATMVYVTHDQTEAMTLGDRITVMNHGAIQQVAIPTVLYQQPRNRFVAGFIGSPPINLLPGLLKNTSAGVALHMPDQSSLLLNMTKAPSLSAQAGRAVLLGIRPEDLHPATSEQTTHLTGQVSLIEEMGDHRCVYLSIAGLTKPVIMSYRGPLPFSLHEQVPLHLHTAHGHVFADDAGEGLNLTWAP